MDLSSLSSLVDQMFPEPPLVGKQVGSWWIGKAHSLAASHFADHDLFYENLDIESSF